MGILSKSKRALSIVLIWALVLAVQVGITAANPGPIKNVIVMIPDGMGASHTTITRWYKGGPLALDAMVVGAVRTHGAESLITDSAPASTAYATGHKSNSKFIGVLPARVALPGVSPVPESLAYKPVATVLEGARLQGKSTGIVATSNVQHATPAAYSAHWPDRSDYNEIAKQQVYQNIDVVFGAGKRFLLPKEMGGARTDGENLVDVLLDRGYVLLETREQLLKTRAPKVWGMFAFEAMAYEFDRPHLRPQEPSLAEMTRAALEILSRNSRGFFLFVEGSKVDWASHANDPIGVISDVLAFDEAVAAALEFAKTDGQTLILSFTDHGNGGMSLGSKKTDKSYDTLPLEALVAPLKKAALTGEGVEQILGADRTEEKVREAVKTHYGISDLTEPEVAAIQKASKGNMNYALGPIMSSRSTIGWTTNGHTGEDVFLYAYGPNRPVGLLENSEIAPVCARALGFELEAIDRRLFAPAEEIARRIGAGMSVAVKPGGGGALFLTKGTNQVEIPFGKNLVRQGEKTVEMEGLAIYAPKTGKAFLPMEAAEKAGALLRKAE